jgi:protease-4
MRAAKSYLVVVLALGLAWAPAAFGQSAKKDAKEAPKPVIAVFSLGAPVLEAPMGDDLLFGSAGGVPLKDLVARMKKARDDKNVKAVVLLMEGVGFSLAQAEELRQVLDQIRTSGKEIHAHFDVLTTRGYALASGASKISMVPTGMVMVMGFYGESLYLRGLLDKIGVKPDFMTCGAYKSAAEMFMRTGPSPEADRMQNWLLDSLYSSYVDLVARGRGVKPEKVRSWIDGGLYTADKARQAGIIDKVQHCQEFVAELKAKYGADVVLDRSYGKKKRGSEIDLSSPLGLFKFWADLFEGGKRKPSTKDAVAIVYVEGPIMPGKADASPFGILQGAYSTTLRKALEKAAEDKTVKAVVLRVNSPGGSAVASEIILDATKRLKAQKPFVVSMGAVAGSGGYYVACGADTIFADATTITASIGVVSGKLATTDMWNKIGITWSTRQRGANAGMLGSDKVFTDSERQRMRELMDDVYGVFKGHVVAIRGKRLKKPIDELAGGRVFTGRQALELGLVDKLGTLDDAIAQVAKQAKLKDYDVRVIPEPKNFLEMLLEDLSDGERDDNRIGMSLGKPASLVDLALPHLKGLERDRLQAVIAALRRLDLFQQERAVMIMPEIVIGN